MSPIQVIARRASEHPDRLAVVHEAGEVSYGRLACDIDAMAATLVARGMTPGEGVAIVFDEASGYLDRLLMLALYRLGITSCSMPQELLSLHLPMLPGLGVRRAVTVSSEVAGAWPAGGDLALADLSGWVPSPPDAPLPASRTDDFVARLQFSSGTTGKPKPIPMLDSRFRISLPRFADVMQFGSDTRALLLFSFYVAPGSSGCLSAFVSGSTLFLPGAADDDDIWNYIVRNRITSLAGPPFILDAFLDSCPPARERGNLRLVTTMGARCPLEVYEKMQRYVPGVEMRNVFGSTEASVIAIGPLTRDSIRQAIAGPIQPYAAAQVVDSEDRPLPAGSAGLLRVRSDMMTEGYVNHPEATKACFKDGWFYTGDQAVIRPDGVLVVVDRTNDIVNYGGRKINLRSIDEVALAQPGVKDACGFVYSDPKGFDEPWLAVVADESLDAGRLFEAIETAGDTVVGIFPVNMIPRNNGKAQRWTIGAAFAKQRALQDAG